MEVELADGQTRSMPLLKTEMRAWIQGDLATVKLEQSFHNPSSEVAHARYIFPLPHDAAVFAMRFTTSDQIVEAEIREKEQAEKIFEQAKQEGKQAALLTQHRPNVFTQRIANLLPGDRVRVELSYAQPVPKRDGAYVFHFPMVVGPRFVPPAELRGTVASEPEPLELGRYALPASPPVARPAEVDPERVSIQVELAAGLPVQWIDSPSHVIDVHHLSGRLKRIQLAEGRTIDNQDFELRYSLAGARVAAGSTACARGGQGVVSLHVEPPADLARDQITAREMVFVLDCSGSMHGVPMQVSKRFMRQALANLRSGDAFRIIRFSHTASGFAETPLPASKANISRGLEYVEALSGQGGTMMTAGIEAALAPPEIAGRMRIVIFLTDGYVGNDADIVRLVQARRKQARLFAFGVGNAVNRYLLEEMARAGRGAVRYVRSDETPEQTADDLARRLDAPFLTDLEIDWQAAPVVDPSPERLPDLFRGERIRVLARYTRPGDYPIIVRGRIAGKPVELPVEIALPAESPEGEALDVLWARSRVHDRMIDYQDPNADAERRQALQEEVTRLGLDHHLVTQWTAFVAVAKKIVNPGGAGAARDVPVPQVADLSAYAYPPGSGATFGAAPEPAWWAALCLLVAMAAWMLRKRRRSSSQNDPSLVAGFPDPP